jgi:hypothetical protein
MKLPHIARFKIALTYLGWTRIHLCLIQRSFFRVRTRDCCRDSKMETRNLQKSGATDHTFSSMINPWDS